MTCWCCQLYTCDLVGTSLREIGWGASLTSCCVSCTFSLTSGRIRGWAGDDCESSWRTPFLLMGANARPWPLCICGWCSSLNTHSISWGTPAHRCTIFLSIGIWWPHVITAHVPPTIVAAEVVSNYASNDIAVPTAYYLSELKTQDAYSIFQVSIIKKQINSIYADTHHS